MITTYNFRMEYVDVLGVKISHDLTWYYLISVRFLFHKWSQIQEEGCARLMGRLNIVALG